MARQFAAVLGLLAFAALMLRGALVGAGLEATMVRAVTSLAAFAAIGAVVGGLAQWILDDTVREQLQAEQSRSEAKKL